LITTRALIVGRYEFQKSLADANTLIIWQDNESCDTIVS